METFTTANMPSSLDLQDLQWIMRVAAWRALNPQIVKLTVGKGVLELLEKLPSGDIAFSNPCSLPQLMLGIPFERSPHLPDMAVCEHYSDGSVRPFLVKVD